ncbi:hypothetical protein PBNK5_01010 [Pectobacterium brasiliense]
MRGKSRREKESAARYRKVEKGKAGIRDACTGAGIRKMRQILQRQKLIQRRRKEVAAADGTRKAQHVVTFAVTIAEHAQ